MNMHNSSARSAGIIGATGYTGMELLRLLGRHDSVTLRFATSEGRAGEESGLPGVRLMKADDAPLDEAAVVFLCVPHGAAVTWAERAMAEGARVVDLTADHRPGSGREKAAVYGMADLAAHEVREAPLVANPGCYPTGVHLALRPLLDGGLLDETRTVVVNAASGVTGAGRTAKRELLFAEVAEDFRPYATGNGHRHLQEMRATLPGLDLLFQPHLLPVSRGILETMYLPVRPGVDAAAVRTAWRTRYGGHGGAATIRVVDGVPALRDVVGTDVLALGAVDNAGVGAPLLTAVAALDNLGKGAAGQAVHNMNIMLGLDAVRGLRC